LPGCQQIAPLVAITQGVGGGGHWGWVVACDDAEMHEERL
jgi:hypothetical protein